jgi:hypothetical protein
VQRARQARCSRWHMALVRAGEDMDAMMDVGVLA